MYVILVYDVSQKRVQKLLKLSRRYLNWVQNSVFEGEISEVQLEELLEQASDLMDLEYDSLMVYQIPNPKWVHKQTLGIQKQDHSIFL